MEKELVIVDAYDEAGDIVAKIKTTNRGISISFEGYEDYAGAENILIENQHGVPHVVVWGDINQEDPTDIVSLEAAHEDNRIEEDKDSPCLCGRGECPECGVSK